MTGLSAALAGAFGDFRLRLNLDLPAAGVSVVFGPSGCGKTTLLRCLAGLEPSVRGRLALGEEVWQDDGRGLFLPAHRRQAGYVFQEAALFPHLTVRQNLEYGYRRTPRERRRVPFDHPVELLGIAHLLERQPGRLSGGERQRVAIARALLASPRLLLMDEPLAALDAGRKREVLPYLETLHRELSIPVVYVTHSPEEAARLGDHLVLMAEGRVRAQGSMQALLAGTDSRAGPLAEIGTVIDARILAHDPADHLSCLGFGGGPLWVAERPEAVGQCVRCRILPGDVSLALARPPASSILNILPGEVVDVSDTDIPGHVQVRLRLGDTRLLARITRRSANVLGLAPGLAVFAQIKSVTLTSESHAD